MSLRVVPDVSKDRSAFLFQNTHWHYVTLKCRKPLIRTHGVITRRLQCVLKYFSAKESVKPCPPCRPQRLLALYNKGGHCGHCGHCGHLLLSNLSKCLSHYDPVSCLATQTRQLDNRRMALKLGRICQEDVVA